jgi:hypothetical protein
MIAVVIGPPEASTAAQFRVTYTNSNGVSGRVTPLITCGAGLVNGTIVSTGPATRYTAGPRLPLQYGDIAVQSIQSVQFLPSAALSLGELVFVLCDTIDNLNVRTIDAPAERTITNDTMNTAMIIDDAYLNFICYPNGSLSGAAFHGYIQTIWG